MLKPLSSVIVSSVAPLINLNDKALLVLPSVFKQPFTATIANTFDEAELGVMFKVMPVSEKLDELVSVCVV